MDRGRHVHSRAHSRGRVIQEIDGKPIDAWYAEQVARVSGSEQFKRWRVRGNFMAGPEHSVVHLVLLRGTDRIEEHVSYDRPKVLAPERPPPIHEIARGIYYVDVTRLHRAALEQSIETLAGAQGIVFDLRGIPTSESASIIPYWITGRGHRAVDEPAAFRPALRRVDPAMADGVEREAQRGVIEAGEGAAHRRAPHQPSRIPGELLSRPARRPDRGGTHRGANGNSAVTTLPSGMQFYLTGMRVTRHDGSLLHVQGFAPDIEVVPTAEGLRAGCDEALERAVKLLLGVSFSPSHTDGAHGCLH
jgi:Periplasmic protease